MEEIVGTRMFGKLRGHRANDAQVVDALGDARKQIADPQTALTAFAEFPRTSHHPADVVELRRLDLENAMRIAAVIFLQERLVIEGVNLRRSTVHVEKNYVASASGKVR